MRTTLACILIILAVQNNSYSQNVPKYKLVRGPYLQSATSNSIIIRWRTDSYARSRVSYGTEQNKLNYTIVDSALKTEHIVELKDLKPSTKYYYSIGGVKDTLSRGADNYFYSLPLAGEKGMYRIGLFGDCGTGSGLQMKVKEQFVRYLGSNYMTAWLLLGDNAYPNGEDAQYQVNFFDVYQNDFLNKYPLFTTPGNHDYHDVEYGIPYAKKSHEIAYFKAFSVPVKGEGGGVPSDNPAFYSFNIGNIHFLSLDSYGEEQNKYRLYDTLNPQVEWVKKDLAANTNREWVIAYWHHPPYTMGTHNSDTEEELVKIRENFLRILERNGVDLVICGHSHNYERSKLMKGHYGPEASFDPKKHSLSSSSGKNDGSPNSCPYYKKNDGTVYVVAGSAGQVQVNKIQKSFPHDAMVYSNGTKTGAAILEVNGNRLELKWITEDGEIADKFTMIKGVKPPRGCK